MASFIIGVAGGSGSGKSTVTEHIIKVIGADKVAVINQDVYYKDLSHIPSVEDRRKVNMDHPDAFDWELMINHVLNLYNGIPVEIPTYDYANYIRLPEKNVMVPAPVVVFEGILALMDKTLREFMSLKIFVDTAPDIRFIRRLQRDILHRGRSVEVVIRQYLDFVRPMHKQFVEPTKRNAHIIIPHGANKAALEMIVARINAVLHNQELIEHNYFDDDGE